METMNEIVWQSQITEEMVSKLSLTDFSLLVNALNDAVMEICQSYEVK